MHSRFICLLIPTLLLNSCSVSCSRYDPWSAPEEGNVSGSDTSRGEQSSTDTSSTSSDTSSSSTTEVGPPKQSDFEYELESYQDVEYARITKVKLDTSIKELTIPKTLDDHPVGIASIGILKEFTSLEKLTTSCVGTSFTSSNGFYTLFGSSSTYVPSSLTEVVIESPNIYRTSVTNLNNLTRLTLKDLTSFFGVNNLPALKSVTLDNVASLGASFLDNTHALEEINVIGGSFIKDEKGDLYDIDKKVLYRALSPISEHYYIAPESLVTINSGAFQNCQEVEEIYLSDKCDSISYGAFKECTSIQRLTLSNAKTPVSYLFSGIPSSLIQVTVRGGTTIGAYFFSNVSTIPTLNLPDTITTIGDYAFSNCTCLTSIYLPNVLSIGTGAFKGCTATIYSFSDYGYSNGYGEGAFENSSITSFTFPSSMTYIKKNFFKNCTQLTNVTLPSNLTDIEEGAFEGCTKLGSINFTSVININKNAFKGCTSLTTLTLPSNIKTIGESAFEGCTNLHQVNFSNASVAIEKNAFYGCTGLTSISNTTNITSLGRYCFSHTTNTFTTAYFPNAVMGVYAFEGWSYLESLTLGSLPMNVTVPELFSNTSFTNTYVVSYTDGATITSYVPNSLKTLTICKESAIASRYAYGMTSLETVNLNEGIYTVYSYAFHLCTGIKKLYLPNTLSTIQSYAFTRLDSCESIDSDPNYAIKTGNRSITIQKTSFSSKNLKWFVVPSGEHAAFADGAIVVPQDKTRDPIFYTAVPSMTQQWVAGKEAWINPSGKYKVYRNYSSGQSSLSGYWHYVNGEPTLW